jgi:hypothetical protein
MIIEYFNHNFFILNLFHNVLSLKNKNKPHKNKLTNKVCCLIIRTEVFSNLSMSNMNLFKS